jgi:uncharacterized cupin superfamily protein
MSAAANSEPLPALDVPAPPRKSIYPAPYAALVEGRVRHRLGDHFGLRNFGINLTVLAPGAISALLHHHDKQDEFIYVVSGTPILVLDGTEHPLQPGDCCGFKAGSGVAHQLLNRSSQPVHYLEAGDRTAGDVPVYPFDDLQLTQAQDGGWSVTHKDGSPY